MSARAGYPEAGSAVGIDDSKTGEGKTIHVVFDQHGTYREPLPGVSPRCLQQPLSDELADFLLATIKEGNIDRLRRIANHSIVIFKNLELNPNEPIIEPSKAKEFKASTLNYKTRPEQEEGLFELAQKPFVSCTMISAMPAVNIEWAMYGLGPGIKALNKDVSIILRRGGNRFVSKLSALMAVMYRFDQSVEASNLLEPRKIVLIDDDRNFAGPASRLLRIPALVPIAPWQERNYPLFQMPKPLKNEQEEVYFGSGLPDLNRSLSASLEGQIPHDRYNAYRLEVGNAVELAGPLSLQVLQRIPPPQRGY